MREAVIALVVATSALSPGAAAAQSAAPPSTEVVSHRREIEVYGGFPLGRFSGGGKTTLPAAGTPIATSSPVFPSWSVPSWFFGDGAAFLNNVAAEFGVQSRVTPLDAMLRPLGLSDSIHGLVGVRVKTPLQAPYALELGFELSAQPVGLSEELLAALELTASSFHTTVTELLGTGPFSAPTVTAATTSAAGSTRDILLTAAITDPGPTFGSFSTYGVAGGGVIIPTGDPTSAGLVGRYQFRIGGNAPVDETDSLTVRYRERTAFVALIGGGVQRAFSDRAGFRLDARVLIGPQSTAVEVDAEPSAVTGTPAAFIESFTYPNLQFSNNSSTGRRSTLGAPALDSVRVFEGGWMIRPRLTAGVYVRF